VLHQPALILPLFDEALVRVQEEVMATAVPSGADDASDAKGPFAGALGGARGSAFPPPSYHLVGCSVKRSAHVRMQQLPASSELCKRNVSALRNTDLGLLVQICGTVVRTASVKMMEFERRFQCQNKTCGRVFAVRCDMSQVIDLNVSKLKLKWHIS
jgi:DNA helicase MCM9